MFPLSAVEVLFAPTKSTQKSAPGRSLSILVRKIFLKALPWLYPNLLGEPLKTPVSRGNLIRAFLQSFLQKLIQQTAIAHFTAIFF